MGRLLGKETVTVRRQTAVTYVEGEPVYGAETEFSAVVSIQPISGKERDDLPEGYRTRNNAKLYTRDDLHVLDVATGIPGDIVEYEGSDWEVLSDKNFMAHKVSTRHRKYMISEIGADE